MHSILAQPGLPALEGYSRRMRAQRWYDNFDDVYGMDRRQVRILLA